MSYFTGHVPKDIIVKVESYIYVYIIYICTWKTCKLEISTISICVAWFQLSVCVHLHNELSTVHLIIIENNNYSFGILLYFLMTNDQLLDRSSL